MRGEGVGTMRPKEENSIDKTEPESGFIESGVKDILETHEPVSIGSGHTCAHGSSLNLEVMSEVKEILFKETHEQVCIGGGHSYAHGGFIYLEIMPGVEGEMVVSEDKLGKLDKELSGW